MTSEEGEEVMKEREKRGLERKSSDERKRKEAGEKGEAVMKVRGKRGLERKGSEERKRKRSQ